MFWTTYLLCSMSTISLLLMRTNGDTPDRIELGYMPIDLWHQPCHHIPSQRARVLAASLELRLTAAEHTMVQRPNLCFESHPLRRRQIKV